MLHQVKEALRVKMANNEYITLVHEATNEDPWGPTGPQMDDIAKVFHNGHSEIMDELILRLKHRKESWRMCYKSMLVIDHLARNVHESSLPIIMPVAPLLRQISMNYTCNEKGVDRGLSVRERARKLADLLTDGELLRDERQKAEQTRRKVAGEPISMGTASPSQRAPSHSSSAAAPPSAQSASGRGNTAGGALRTNLRAEQEQQDMILAMRLQTEEDRRAQAAGQTIEHGGPILVGRTVKPAAKKASMPSYPKPTSQEEADHYLALEMQRRLDNGEPITPTVFEQLTFRPPTTTTTAGSTTAPVASSSGAAPPKAQASTLDDLFAFGNNTSAPPPPPPPSAPSTTLEGTSSSPPASAASKNRHNGPQQPAELTATSLFADTTSTYNRNTSTTSSSSQQQQQGAAFDPFSTAPPPPPPPQGETDFFDNFLAQRKDLHKSASQQQQATTTSSSSATAATNAGSLEFFQTSSSSSLPSHKNNNNNTDAAVAAPNGTDLFELQMQRLSVSAQPSSQQQQTAARGMTLDDMLRDGKSF